MLKLIKKLINSNGDNKTILVNSALAFLIKGGSLFLALFTMPAYMRYFDSNVILGAWLTMVAIMSWVLNFDLGIGNGLRNKLVAPLVKNDYNLVKKYISSAYISLGVFTILLATLGYFLVGLINWNDFFGVSPSYISSDTLLKTIQIVLLGTLLQFFLRIITSILFAMQKSFIPNLLNLCTTILLLVFIYTGLAFGMEQIAAEKNLVTLAYVNVIAVNLPLLITTILVFKTELKGCLPTLSYFEKKYAQEVMKLGIVFLWLQFVFMLINNTNEFLITWLVDSGSVVEYQIYFKLFTLGGTLIALVLTPIWSAVTKAKAEENYTWIRKLNNILMLLGFVGICIQFLLIPFLQPLINFWLGENAIEVNYFHSVVFAISGGVFLWNRIVSAMSNGFGELRMQMLFLSLGAVLNFPLSYILTKVYESYLAIVIANILSLLPYCIIQAIWMSRFLNKKCKEISHTRNGNKFNQI